MTKTLRIKNPGDLIAAVPTVLGFHPEDSVVLLCLGNAGNPFFARVDMPASAAEVEPAVAQVGDAAARHGGDGVAVVTFTDDTTLSCAVVAALARRLEPAGVTVQVAVRADGSRWFLVPPEEGEAIDEGAGTPYDITSHPFTLQAVVDGRIVHRSRDALRDSLLPTDPDAVDAVAEAMDDAVDRCTAASRLPLGQPDPAGAANHLVAEGRWVQARLRRFLADGVRLDDAEVGRLVVALVAIQVRDVAWSEMDRDRARRHVDLWSDVVRRTPLDGLAAPASLLAFAAWLAGDGALAWCAVDRAQEAEPGYGMAGLVAQALTRAVPPSSWEPIPPDALPLFAG